MVAGRGERRLRAGRAAGQRPDQARRFPRQAHRHAAVRQHAGRRRPRLARRRRPAHHADRRRRAGRSRPPTPTSCRCSRASSSMRSGPSSPGCRASSWRPAARCWSRRRTRSRPCWPRAPTSWRRSATGAAVRRGPPRADRMDQAEPGGGAASRARGAPGRRFRVEMSPDLVARAWRRMTLTADTALGGVPGLRGQRPAGRFPARRAGPVAADRDALMQTRPGRRRAGPRPSSIVEGVSKWFTSSRATVHALDNVSLDGRRGRVRLPRRPERLRQVHAARHHRRPDHARRGPGAGRRQARRGPGPPAPGDVPGIGAVSLARRLRQRDVRAEAAARNSTPRGAPGDRRSLSSSWSVSRSSSTPTSTSCPAA